jgi:hypothetical protein
MKLTKIESIPKGNPFLHILWHMGTPIGKDLMIMHMNHTEYSCKDIILVNPETGERYKLDIKDEKI